MTITNNGINRVRSLFNADLFKAQLGTGTNAPSSTDTALQTPVATTLLTPTSALADKAVQVTHAISTAIGATTTFSEQEIQLNSGSTHFNRIVHTGLLKGGLDEFTYITTIFFKSV